MIHYSVVYAEEAFHDLEQTMNWYRDKRVGLEDEFLLNVEASVNKIQRNPLSYPPFFNHARQIRLQRFPYKIIFKLYEDATIKIYGIFHNKRDPQFISERLK